MPERKPLTVEEIIREDAYEARVHLFLPDKNYSSIHRLVHDTTTDAIKAEIDRSQLAGFPMWVDFFKFHMIDPPIGSDGGRPSVQRQKVGELAVSVSPHDMLVYDDVLEQGTINPFMNVWLGAYALDTSRSWCGNKNHPTDPIHGLYQLKGFRTLEEYTSPEYTKTQNEEAYIARLAQAALIASPDIEDWLTYMDIPSRIPCIEPPKFFT